MAKIMEEGFALVVSLFMMIVVLELHPNSILDCDAAVIRAANHEDYSFTSSGASSSSSSSSSLLNRTSFPPGFVFGAGSASYQFEGAAREGGKGLSIWDTYTHKYPEKIEDHTNGDVADDSYHRYKEDVRLLKEMGMDAYRFSISWPRLLPGGKLRRGVNNEGIQYYNNLINELLSNGMQPFVTLFHWDIPQALEDDYGGFLSPHIIDDFRDYAALCYEKFGDRVKHWVTINEAWAFSNGGYAEGTKAPGRCSKWVGNCSAGNSATEPYIVTHNLLLAHAAAVREYKEKYQASQKGNIGITLVSHWFLPFSNDKSNKDAAERALDFMFGWFLDPLTYGEYPQSMRSLVGDRLPKFTEEQSHMVKGSFDFLGINYYTSNYAANVPSANNLRKSYTTDHNANCTTQRNGKPIGVQTGAGWQFICPRGIQDLLIYTKKKYNNPVMYITENGMGEFNNNSLTLEEALKDDLRESFHRRHLLYVQRAIIKDGVDVRGYFVWSLLDNFEWGSGYTVRFGINYVDYKDGLKRYPKKSAIWFKKFLQK